MRQWNRCVRVSLVLACQPHCSELTAKSERGIELKYNAQFFSKIAPLSLGYLKMVDGPYEMANCESSGARYVVFTEYAR